LTEANAVGTELVVEFHDQSVVTLARGVEVLLAAATVDE
jgi:hypothetical protein